MADGQLCSQCQKIPFQLIFTRPLRVDIANNQGIYIGTLRELWARDGCAFCTLVKYTFSSHYGRRYVETQLTRESGCELVVSQSPIDLRYDIWDPSTSDAETESFYLEIHSSKPPLARMDREMGDEFNTSWGVPKVHLILDESQAESVPGALHGRPVFRDTIDWAYLTEWLKTCKSRQSITQARQDGKSGGSQSGNILGPARSLDAAQLHVIDVDRLCVVPMPKDDEYVALSYRWGNDQALKLKEENADLLKKTGFFDPLSENIKPSRTIVDALEVIRRLGYRYLWVDALCVTQDDQQAIMANVGVMDLIYTRATLTIVAAFGDDANSGLPGVSWDIPRTQQQRRHNVHGLVVANMLDSLNDAINYSAWNTRGWTYQERLLSSRRLVFTNAQVYYECNQECHFQEDLRLDDGSVKLAPRDGRYQIDLENENLFNIYALVVAEYTKRSLTDQCDKLKAFTGFLSTLVEPFRGPFFFGLPVGVFNVGLLWTPIGACTRSNKIFPSWSWAGWDGPVRYAMRDSMENLCECAVSQVKIETHRGVQLCTRADHLSLWSNASSRGEAESWSRHIDEDIFGIYYTLATHAGEAYPYRYPRPLEAIGKEEAQMLRDSDPAILKFTGLSASFLLTGQHSQPYIAWSTCKEGRHENCALAIFDDQGQVAGTVFVAGSVVPQLQRKTHRFLALNRSTLRRMDDDPSWDEKTRCFRCWTHPESGALGEPSSDDEDLINAFGVKVSGREVFDVTKFNQRVFWPLFDVLLLTEQGDGTAERLGIGKIHVDAFLPVAKESCILLR